MIAELQVAGVLRASALPGSARTLSRLLATGTVRRLLPGIYALASQAESLVVRCAALMLWAPDAVVTGRAAAKLSYWTEARVGEIEFHSATKKVAPAGFRLHRSQVPEADVVER